MDFEVGDDQSYLHYIFALNELEDVATGIEKSWMLSPPMRKKERVRTTSPILEEGRRPIAQVSVWIQYPKPPFSN